MLRCCQPPAGGKQLSTGDLHWSFEPRLSKKEKQTLMRLLFFFGAGDEARTRYLHLGKVALYRMSYTRGEHGLL